MSSTMTDRMLNFSAGPATLPLAVLEEAAENLISLGGCGVGVAEVSHRSPEYTAVHEGAEASIRNLLGAGDDWSVLFLQGGASSQFFMVPYNLGPKGDYLVAGNWGKKAHAEAERMGHGHVAASSADTNFDHIPKDLDLRPDADYVHVTSNNTIFGTQLHAFPSTDAPLVCDASSDILSRPMDLSRFGVIYAGAQKNLGPAGVTLVLIRNELLERSPDSLPTMLNYNTHASKGSLYNTPPAFAIYVVGLVARWIESNGGLAAMEVRNKAKADRLYGVIDSSDFYSGPAAREDRSNMNVPFTLKDDSLDGAFLQEAEANGMVGLKGYRTIGGMRASIYNAMEPDGVERLAAFMEDFERRNA